MKSDFLARPVNLYREDRIKAHFMTCFISLFIYRLLEKSQIINTQLLKYLILYIVEQKGIGFEPIYERTNITDKLHDLFKFNTDLEIVSYKKRKKILNTNL